MRITTSPAVCAECARPLPAGLPSLMCPQCLLGGALDDERFPDDKPIMGDWRLLEEIGRGGMGVVYRAQRVDGGPEVALKTLVFGELATPEMLRRFRQESKAAAALQHPHLVSILDVGDQDGVPFLVMTLINGRTLSARLAEGAMPPREAVVLMRTVAEAVSVMHRAGILHRDLKPSNILLDEDGAPFVSDFGLAKQLTGGSLTEVTRTGQVLGSPAYMPPEQARGDHAKTGPASDVYALGAILYHLLAGRAPFSATTMHEMLQKVELNDPPPLRRANEAVPHDLETICLHCMEKEPAARCPSAQALADDLARWLAGEPVRARRAGFLRRRWRWCRRRPVLAALGFITLALLAALGGSIFLTTQKDAANAAQRQAKERGAALKEARAAIASHEPGRRSRGLDAVKRAASPESADELRDTAIALITQPSFEPLSARPLPPGAHAAAFSTDLKHAAYARDGVVHIIRPGDGAEILSFDESASRKPEDGAPEMLEFSPAGGFMAVHSAQGLVRLWRFENFTADQSDTPPNAPAPGAVLHGTWQTTASAAHGFVPVCMSDDRALSLRLAPCKDHPAGAIVYLTLADSSERVILDAPAPEDFFVANPKRQSGAICRGGVLNIVFIDSLKSYAVLKAPSRITCCVWQADGNRILAGCANGELLLTSSYTKYKLPLSVRRHSAPLRHLEFSGRDLTLLTASEDGFARVSVGGGTNEVYLEMSGLTGFGFSRSSDMIAAVDAAGRLLRWIKAPAAGVVTIKGPVGSKFESWDIDFAAGSQALLMESTENLVLRIDASATMGLETRPERIRGAAFTPDGGMVLTMDSSGFRMLNAGSLPVLDVRPFTLGIRVESDPAWLPRRFCFGRDGTLALESADGRYGTARWPDMKLIRALPGRRASSQPGAGGGPGGSGALAVSPDGAWIAGGFPESGTAVVWEARTGTVAKELPGTGVVCFSPDGRWLLLGSETQWRLMETGTWREHWTRPRQGAARQWGAASFAADGKTLVLDTDPLLLTLVDTESARPLANFPLPDAAACTSVRYDSAHGRLYAGTRSNTVWRWDLPALREALRAAGLAPGF